MSTPPKPARLLGGMVAPALWLFALPLVAVGFATLVRSSWDRDVRDDVLQQIHADQTLSAEDVAQGEAFAAQLSAAEVCAGDGERDAQLRQSLGEWCGDYAQIRWMTEGGLVSLAVGLAASLAGGAAALAAFMSRRAQIPAFAFAWNLLRATSALQVVLQGALAVALSYWVTAFTMHMYSVKLIAVAGLLAATGAFTVLKSIFAKVDLVTSVEGQAIDERAAPAFWARLRELASSVGTAAPDRVIGGIDDNFFVTESTVAIGGERVTGRTLFASLPLLRTLTKAEAEAVLCHELAHFSGGDTEHSRRLAPMRARYARYLQGLGESPMARPVFHLMLAVWNLFQWAFARGSRERELRADRVAAEQTSPAAICGALLKVSAYSAWRRKVEGELFAQDQAIEAVAIPQRVSEGFAAFVRGPDLADSIGGVPHPMDSHPPNTERFEALGQALPTTSWRALLLHPVDRSWYEGMPTAPEVEARLWTAYEARFAARHEFRRAFHLHPTTAEDRALVERHFPRLVLVGKKGETVATLTFEHLTLDGEGRPIALGEVTALQMKDGMLGKELILTAGGRTSHLKLKRLKDADADVQRIALYVQRARNAAGRGES